MIGRLRGRLEYRSDDHVLIDVAGIGYQVYCSERTLAGLPGTGEAVSLYTDLLVREDLLQLFGFTTLLEKEWHRLLMSVQGVGAKVSLAILGALGPDGVSRAIAVGDWKSVQAARGVGPKTAQRIVLDLKEKAPGVMALAGKPPAVSAPVGRSADKDADVIENDDPGPPPDGMAQADALSALSNLGYSLGEAAGAVAEAAGETPGADASALIRLALKRLAPKT